MNGHHHDPPQSESRTQPFSFDTDIFRMYLLALLTPIIDALPSELGSLFDDEFDERVARFAAESGGVVYIVKVKGEVEDDGGTPTHTYHLTPHLTYHTTHVTTLALIKRTTHLDPLVLLSAQLHFLNFFGGDETQYESLHTMVSCGVKPWFDAFVGTRAGAGKDAGGEGGGGEAKLGIPMTKKKDLYKDILRSVEDLSTCSYTSEAFSDLLGKVQAAIDRLNLEGYTNLEHWVAELDKRIQGIPLQRLTHIIQVWCAEFDRVDDSDTRRDLLPVRDVASKRRGDKRMKEEKFKEGDMMLKPFVHEIRIQNQVIFLDPPIEYARSSWIRQLHDWFGVICRLRRIQGYEIGLQMQGVSSAETTYMSLLTCFTDNTLEHPFALIEYEVQGNHLKRS